MTPCTTPATQLSAPGVEMAGSGTCAAGRIQRARLLWIALLGDPARPAAASLLTSDVWAARRGRAPPAAASRPREVKAQLLRRAWVHRRGRKAVKLDAHLPPLALLQVPLGQHQRGGCCTVDEATPVAALLWLCGPTSRKLSRRADVGESAAQAAARVRPLPPALAGASSSSYLRTLRARAAAVEVAQQIGPGT